MGSLSGPIEAITRRFAEPLAKALGPNVTVELVDGGFSAVLYDVVARRIAAKIEIHDRECPCGWRYIPGRFRECVSCGGPIMEARRP